MLAVNSPRAEMNTMQLKYEEKLEEQTKKIDKLKRLRAIFIVVLIVVSLILLIVIGASAVQKDEINTAKE